MSTFGSPMDVVRSLLSALTAKDRKELREALGVTPCETLGHKFKNLRTVRGLFGLYTYTIIYCERCGATRRR